MATHDEERPDRAHSRDADAWRRPRPYSASSRVRSDRGGASSGSSRGTRQGDQPRGEKKPYGDKPRGEKKPYGDKPRGEKKPYGDKARGSQGDRGRGADDRGPDPALPDDVSAADLASSARNELKTLSKENAETVARHLAMAARLIDEDPARAHEHALAATRRAGRIAMVRETAAITAYAIGDYALALRELRTFRRISGRDDQLPLMVDSERGVGRPDRALELGRSVERSTLSTAVRVELAIAMSGARLDLGDPLRALQELEIPEFDPDRAFDWSPSLFAARATVLEELGREDEAREWHRRAVIAAAALDEASGSGQDEVVVVEELVIDETAAPDPDAPGAQA